jgi:hypothetical protein
MSPTYFSESTGPIKSVYCPGKLYPSKLSFRPAWPFASGKMHLKPGYGQGQHARAQDGHGRHLGPEEGQTGPLEKNPLADDDEVNRKLKEGKL